MNSTWFIAYKYFVDAVVSKYFTPIAETKSITVIVSGKNLRRTNIFQILIGEELYSKCIQGLPLTQYPDSKSLVYDMLSYPECIISIKNSGVSCPAIVLQRPSATK